jgi:hypothetical protein
MTPSCCGTSCQTTHNNGLGEPYYDCSPLGTPGLPSTYTATMASEARTAWPNAGTDNMGTCGNGANASACIGRATAGSCAVWCYTKGLAGYVHLNLVNNQCYCPTTSDPSWN